MTRSERKSGHKLNMEGVKEFEPHRLDFEQESQTENTPSEELESVRPDFEEILESIISAAVEEENKHEKDFPSKECELATANSDHEDEVDDIAKDDEDLQKLTSDETLEDGELSKAEIKKVLKEKQKKSGRGKDKNPRKPRGPNPKSGGIKKPRHHRGVGNVTSRRNQRKKPGDEVEASSPPTDLLVPPVVVKAFPPGPPGPPGPATPMIGPPRTILNFSNFVTLNDLVKELQ